MVMGEPQSSRASLPPGCQFFPSEEQLLCYYLTNKINNKNKNNDANFCGCDLIPELDLYDHDPFELPDIACFSYGCRGTKRHWYCYTVRVLKETGRSSRRRMVKSGYWLRQGRVKDVFGSGGKVLLGTRTSFVFYLGNSPKNAVRTDWMLYQYSLLDHLVASLVLCRVFVKPRRKSSGSEIGLSSCAEESVSAVRHIGIQHDAYATSDVVEAKVCDNSSIDRKNEILVHVTAPVPVSTSQCSMVPQGSLQGRFSGFPGGGAMFIEAVTSPILEEDFIELDDLA